MKSCGLIDAELDRGFQSDLSEQARQHLRECQRCRDLYRWISERSSAPDPSPDLNSAIQSRLHESLKPVAPRPSIGTLAGQFLVVFLLLASPAIAMLGIAGFQHMWLRQVIGVTSVLALGAGLLSLSLAWQITPGSLQRIPSRVALPILAVGFLGGIALLFPWHAPEAFLAQGWRCFRSGLLMVFPAALLFWLLARRGAVLAVGILGGTLGAIAGLLGATVLQYTCARQDAVHLFVWHGGVLVVSIALGALLAKSISHLPITFTAVPKNQSGS